MISRPIYGAYRMSMVVLIALLYTLPYAILLRMNKEWGMRFGRFYLRSWCRAIGHKVRIEGEVSPHKPTLFVGNHISYVDILVCGFLEGRFVAKQDVKSWPLFGMLTTWQRSIYINRTPRAIAQGYKDLEKVVLEGDSLILFPEGTTSDGCRVLPFSSSFFGLALEHHMPVQPFTIIYEGWDNVPMPRYLKKMVGWFSVDMELVPHLWFLCQLGRVNVVVRLHEPLNPQDFSSRKALSERAWEVINRGRYRSLDIPSSPTEMVA